MILNNRFHVTSFRNMPVHNVSETSWVKCRNFPGSVCMRVCVGRVCMRVCVGRGVFNPNLCNGLFPVPGMYSNVS